MKNIGKPRFFLVWIALLSYLVLGFGALSGMVLCFEPDGRVVLESGIDGVCSDSWEEKQQVQVIQAKAPIQVIQCKRCTDIPLSLSSIDTQSSLMSHPFQESIQIPMAFSSEFSQDWMGFLATATQSVLPHPPPLRPAIHAFLSTIILLI